MTEDDEQAQMQQDARAAQAALAAIMTDRTRTLPDDLAVKAVARAVARWLFGRADGSTAALRQHLAFAVEFSSNMLIKDTLRAGQEEATERARVAAGTVADAVRTSAMANGRRRFPIMAGASGRSGWLPWSLLAPHEAQAWSNHGQSLDRLAARGGLDWSEALAVLEDRPWRLVAPEVARRRVLELHAATVNVEHVDGAFAAHEAAMAAEVGAPPLPALPGTGEVERLDPFPRVAAAMDRVGPVATRHDAGR